MLVLSRGPGESVVINDATIVTVTVIGSGFVDLALKTATGRPLETVTLGTAGLLPLAEGVSAVLIRTDAGRARLGFDIPRDVAFRRAELRDPA